MTSDGISTKDWDRVKDRAAKIASAICAGRAMQAKKETKLLLSLLDKLQERYGELPSILATRADYVTNVSQSVSLLKRAYALAENNKDKANLTYITSSLAELYLVDRRDKKNGKIWLAKLRDSLKNHFDKYEFSVFKTLSKLVRKRS